ncbi:CLUMA_CG018121, isoform A [Clunio marinus]|uniref:CLUMA_CG018121, isoform A n=1 Tax=Clunio marinus TaxID=568069 RepID=A0A1J1IZ79_9DIPT|nr:CLUMA_CG018121, isoform A [Clunio marinus]
MAVKCKKCEKFYKNKEGANCFICGVNKHMECDVMFHSSKAKHPFTCDMTLLAIQNNHLFFICESCQDAKTNPKSNSVEYVNNELTQKLNEILKKVLQLEEKIEEKGVNTKGEKIESTQMSYAKVVKIDLKNGRSSKNINAMEKVRNSIDPQKLQASDMRSTPNGGVTFKCQVEKEQDIEAEIKKKLGSNFDVKINEQRKPSLRIYGLYDDKNLSSQTLEDMIRTQNSSLIQKTNSLYVKKVTGRKNNTNVKTIWIDCDVDVYRNLTQAKAINIGWSRCNVVDGINPMRCYKCSRYAHKGSVCNKPEECCPKCSKNHLLTNHNDEIHGEEKKCINCLDANEKFNLKMDTNHAVWDKTCKIYQLKHRKLMNSIIPEN